MMIYKHFKLLITRKILDKTITVFEKSTFLPFKLVLHSINVSFYKKSNYVFCLLVRKKRRKIDCVWVNTSHLV